MLYYIKMLDVDKQDDIKMLDVDKQKVYENKHFKNLYRVGVQPDGTCLIHSLLFLTDSNYRKLSVSNKHTEGINYRIKLASLILKALKSKAKHTKRIKSFFENIDAFINKDTYPTLEKYVENFIADPLEYLDEHFIYFLETLKLVNIIVFTNNGELYIRDTTYNTDYDTILMYNIDNIHFEPIVVKKNNTTKYVLDSEDDKNIVDKLIRTYRKKKRMEELSKEKSSLFSSSTSPQSSKKQKTAEDEDTSKTSTQKENILQTMDKNEIESETPIISEDNQPVVSQIVELVREDTPSTEQDYYETMIAEDELIFEELSDLNEITLVRVDKNAPLFFSDEQASHEINNLYNYRKKPLTPIQNTNFIKLLNKDEYLQNDENHNNILKLFKPIIPIVNATKEFSSDTTTEEDMSNDNEYTLKMRTEHLEEMKQLFKVGYKTFNKSYADFVQFIYPLGKDFNTNLVGSEKEVIRLCPSKYKEFLDADVNDESMCYRYDYVETEEFEKIKSKESRARFERISLNQTNKIKNANFLEFYKYLKNDINVSGYFITCENKRHTKFSVKQFTIVNVSRYYEKIVNLKSGDVVKLTYTKHCDSKSSEGRVMAVRNGIIEIGLEESVMYRGSPKSTVYFDTNIKNLKDNWFCINPKTGNVFDKSVIFDKDLLCLFDEKTSIMKSSEKMMLLLGLILPDFFEVMHLQRNMMKTLYNLQEINSFIHNYFHVGYDDIVNSSLQTEIIERMKKNMASIKEIDINVPRLAKVPYKNFRHVTSSVLKFKYMNESNYYKSMQNQTKHLDSELNRIHLLHSSIDNGMAHFMSFIRDGFESRYSKTDAMRDKFKTKIDLYEKDIKRLKENVDTKVKEKLFYSTIEELLQNKKQLQLNKKYRQLVSTHKWLQMYHDNKPISEEIMNTFSKHVWFFYKINLKPQSHKNISFLKYVNKPEYESQYLGTEAQGVNLEQSFSNLEDTRVLNFEPIGTYEKDVIRDDKENLASKVNTVQNYITEIAHHFGMLKMKKEEREYIENNSYIFAQMLIEEKKKAIMKKNPKLKDFSKMFKNEKDKLMYLEYSTIMIVVSFMLIFINMNRRKIEVCKLHSKCRELFALQGYPLTSVDKTNKKSTVSYFACLIKHVYRNNTLLADFERNKQKILKVVSVILNIKSELKNAISLERKSLEQTLDGDEDLSDVTKQYERNLINFKPSAKTNGIGCNSNISTFLPTQTSSLSFALPPDTKLIQLTITKIAEQSKFVENSIIFSSTTKINSGTDDEKTTEMKDNIQTFVKYNDSSYGVEMKKLLDNNFSSTAWTNFVLYVEDHLIELKELLMRLLSNEKNDITQIFDTINKIFVLHDDIEEEDLHLYVETLNRFIETRMRIPLSKIQHNTNKEEYIDYLSTSSLLKKYLKRSPGDKEFLQNLAQKKQNDQHTSLVNNVNNIEQLRRRVLKIPIPDHIHLLQSKDDRNKKHNDMLLMYVIITYMENILNAVNKDIATETDKYSYIYNIQHEQYELQLLCTLIIQSLKELPELLNNQDSTHKSFKSDVEYMREVDKKQKFDFKDSMSDSERLLYINFEQNGLVKNMNLDSFHDDMNYTQPIELYADFQNADGYNPEYVPNPGENSDETDE